jgi:hypothetical protein
MMCLYFYEYPIVDQVDAVREALITGGWLGMEEPYRSPTGTTIAEVLQPSTDKRALYNLEEKSLMSDAECVAILKHNASHEMTASSLYLQAA